MFLFSSYGDSAFQFKRGVEESLGLIPLRTPARDRLQGYHTYEILLRRHIINIKFGKLA